MLPRVCATFQQIRGSCSPGSISKIFRPRLGSAIRFAKRWHGDSTHFVSVEYDAVIVGSGPNGLAAAIALARAGYSVLVREANATIGGGARSAELTLPKFVHDVCSAVHPLAAGSPFFKTLSLDRTGLDWIQPEIPLGHPLDDGSVACLHQDIDVTAEQLRSDSR